MPCPCQTYHNPTLNLDLGPWKAQDLAFVLASPVIGLLGLYTTALNPGGARWIIWRSEHGCEIVDCRSHSRMYFVHWLARLPSMVSDLVMQDRLRDSGR